MKRIIALLTLLAMLLSCVAVSADGGVEERFKQLLTTQVTEGNFTAKVSMSGGSPMIDMLGEDAMAIKALLNSSIDYNINAKSNADATAAQAEGKLMFNSGAEAYGIPSAGFQMWMDMNIEDMENIQYYMIIKLLGEGFDEYKGSNVKEYFLLDYTKIPGFKELIKSVAEIGALDRDAIEDILNNEELQQLIAEMFKNIDINPVYANGKYSLVMGDREIKKTIATLFNNIVDVALSITGDQFTAEKLRELDEQKAEIAEIIKPIADVQLFDSERGLVLELSEDGTEAHMEVNLDTNLYDLISALEGEEMAITAAEREFFDVDFSVMADMKVSPLPDGYAVVYPTLNGSNSVDIFADEYGRNVSFEAIDYAKNSNDVIEIMYNGNTRKLDNKPMIINDRTFVPFRALANMLGVDDEHIGYDEATEMVTLSSDGIEIVMYIGSSVVYVNGEMKVLDVPAFTSDDRTYIPVRFVSEMFGKTVGYENNNGVQTITIAD